MVLGGEKPNLGTNCFSACLRLSFWLCIRNFHNNARHYYDYFSKSHGRTGVTGAVSCFPAIPALISNLNPFCLAFFPAPNPAAHHSGGPGHALAKDMSL